MLYHFELQMAGAILFTAMLVGGIYMWIKRRQAQRRLDTQNDASHTSDAQKTRHDIKQIKDHDVNYDH